MNWIRSSACESASCVEVTRMGSRMVLRNSAEPSMVAEFNAFQWGDFLREVVGVFAPRWITHTSSGDVIVEVPNSDLLLFTAAEWAVFELAVRNGEMEIGRVSA